MDLKAKFSEYVCQCIRNKKAIDVNRAAEKTGCSAESAGRWLRNPLFFKDPIGHYQFGLHRKGFTFKYKDSFSSKLCFDELITPDYLDSTFATWTKSFEGQPQQKTLQDKHRRDVVSKISRMISAVFIKWQEYQIETESIAKECKNILDIVLQDEIKRRSEPAKTKTAIRPRIGQQRSFRSKITTYKG